MMFLVPISAFADDGSQIVIATKSGRKYHLGTCQRLGASRIPIPVYEAIEKGYEPCKACAPPILENQPNDTLALYRLNTIALSSFHDADITKMLNATLDRVVGCNG